MTRLQQILLDMIKLDNKRHLYVLNKLNFHGLTLIVLTTWNIILTGAIAYLLFGGGAS